MNSKRTIVTLLAAGLLAGCAQQKETQFVQVRFTAPVTLNDLDSHAYGFTGASVASYPGNHPSSASTASAASSPASVPQFESATKSAALWGGPYHGADVTFNQTTLEPGFYNFAYWDGSQDADLVGSIRVNATSNDLVDTFRRWKAQLPVQRQRAAYGFEIKGNVEKADAHLFKALTRRIEAIDDFEDELDEAIQRELARRNESQAQQRELLSTAIVHLFPSGGYHYADQSPAFAASDFDRVHSGEAVTKVVLVADHHQVQARIRDIDRLGQKLSYLNDSLRDEIRRLEGAKALKAIVFKNHDDFVRNETRLREALEDLDELNLRLGDLRSRRLALAFVGELFSPGSGAAALESELATLQQEKAVLGAEQERVDALFARTNAVSPNRVQLERRRQRVRHALSSLDKQSEFVADARGALAQMQSESAVVYRQGVLKLLAATAFDQSVPTPIRDALEHESVMVVRLQRRTTGSSSLANFSSSSTASWASAQPQSTQEHQESAPQPQQEQKRAFPASYSPTETMIEMQPD